jgi:hypothetical protein
VGEPVDVLAQLEHKLLDGMAVGKRVDVRREAGAAGTGDRGEAPAIGDELHGWA